MFVLARRWFDRRDAMFAAVLYTVNPYLLVVVYWRSAFAELLASCLVPMLLLAVVRLVEDERRVVIPLALVLAAAWLTNAPAAVMIHYSLALLLLLVAWQRRSLRPLLAGVSAVALGASLAGFYLLPAIYEQKWVNIAEAVSAGSRPQDNFLFQHTTDADHDAFNRIISWVAILEIVVTLAAAWTARSYSKVRSLWNALACWAAVCGVLMFPVTVLLWRFLPKLEFMQFPWRWLLCLSAISTVLVTAGLRSWRMRVGVAVVGVVVVGGAWHVIQPPWWDNAADLREMHDNVADGIGYEGTDEYTPVGADASAIDKNVGRVVVSGSAQGTIQVMRWEAESKSFTAEMSAPDQLALRLFRYPAWRAEVNGHMVETSVRGETGQMLVPVEAGTNRVEIKFVRTWDRTAGGWISAVTVMALIGWSLLRRKHIAITSSALSS